MKIFDNFNKNLKIITIAVLFIPVCFHCGCLLNKPKQPTEVMGFEKAIQAMANHLYDQLYLLKIKNILPGRHRINIIIDPFIDVESGSSLKINKVIVPVLAKTFADKFNFFGLLEPDKLIKSDYILNGIVSIVPDAKDNTKKLYVVYSTIFDKTTGQVLAESNVTVKYIDTSPIAIYNKSPTYIKGSDYQQLIRSITNPEKNKVEEKYRKNLYLKSHIVKGNSLYEKKDFKKAQQYYQKAMEFPGGEERMDVLNMNFVTYVQFEYFNQAEVIFKKLLNVSIKETGGFSNKIIFQVNSIKPVSVGNIKKLYGIYLRQIAQLAKESPDCRIDIIGHCSKSGSASYNNRLSAARARWIQRAMSGIFPGIYKCSKAIGKGYQDNIVGTGSDDITDQIDRRVEFQFYNCQ